jgi:LuxR family maltose regulon positive regulatory protein
MPGARPHIVLRPRLSERLNSGLYRKLTLISAPAGFGKTTLISAWLAGGDRRVAWLSLDEGENDHDRFLTYLVAALQTISPDIGAGVLQALRSPRPAPAEALLTTLLNELSTLPYPFIIVLDDYHMIESTAVEGAVRYLVEHLPSQMHLVIATREDPELPLARLRAQDQLSELRVADLRFTPAEAAVFLTQSMNLTLSADDITAIEGRTEGWIAGLQLAALSLQGEQDPTRFIHSFTGSHQFVLDYLVEEVLSRQPERIQTFLLRTSILERLCGPLCDAVLCDSSGSGQGILEYLDRANLFLVPLDHERRWYRYHHLFAEALRQRLMSQSMSASSGHEQPQTVATLHIQASIWYEAEGLDLEAFQHAAAARDVARAARLMEGSGMPVHYRGVVTALLDWLGSLPPSVLDDRPALWVRYATLLLTNGQTSGVEEKLQAAEGALEGVEPDDETRDLIGQIAGNRATLALPQYQADTILAQSRRALENLHPDNLTSRTSATWTLGVAFNLQGDRAAARRAYTEAIGLSQASGDIFTTLLALLGLGNVQEADNQLHLAAETYQRMLQLAGDPPQPIAGEAHLPLARIFYQWDLLPAAERHTRVSLHLARHFEPGIDRFVLGEVFLACVKLAQGDIAEATALLAAAGQAARQNNFVARLPDVVEAQVVLLLRQGKLAAAAHLAERHDIPLSRARVHLAQGNPGAALAVLVPWRRQVEAAGWADARLKAMVVEALALEADGDQNGAIGVISDVLAQGEPEGFIRLFIDEGAPMARLLAAARDRMPDYVDKLLAAFPAEDRHREHLASPTQPVSELLSHRELEVLRLIALGRSDQEIAGSLVIAVSTVKGHNRSIFGKLNVQRRTEAVARARELGLL